MPNTIKYSTTGDTLSLKKGNWYIGVGDTPKGPTSDTGHWNGITPSTGAYTIYENKSANGPSIRVPSDSSTLIDYAKRLYGGTNINNVYDALNYLNGQTTMLCVNRDYESVVTNGLIYNLDAGFSPSYPTSGSTWTDVSVSARTATLINTPTFNSDGYINFSKASLEYATTPNIGTIQTWTVEAWVRFSSSLNGQVAMVVGNQFNGSTSINFTIGTNSAPTSYNIVVGFFQNGWNNTTGFAPLLNTWYQIVGRYGGGQLSQFVNGVASGGTVNVTATLASGGEIRLMRRWDDVVSSTNLIDGDLGIVRIYNRFLSSTEILQNFNAQKARFGL